ncbi:predicted hydrolase [Pelotomaculum thermopropionicum SI]|uniref:Predicted hydrolase n=1 Tax=Pelotomaculum thermopropionicum (strain DSM 13744 / JCM 10971 / SI) TaxID=370438 RepID=A5CZL9_PELTS|nr:predicted hydrolase [Pelotomaculum thermopropionicum SI]
MLKVHFLNVGHGDCTIIMHPFGRLTMIDINNGTELDSISANEILDFFTQSKEDLKRRLIAERLGISKSRQLVEAGYDIQLTNPIEFLKQQYPNNSIFRYIQTHPDLDHMRGLVALREVGIQIWNFWDTKHNKIPDFQWESDEEEWEEYKAFRTGKRGAKVLYLYRGARGIYYNQEPEGVDGGDGLEILSPTSELVEAANEAGNTNNLSYVLRLTYKGIRIIFGGDAEKEAWDSIVGHYGEGLKCHVLKASHHGRETGYHQEAVKLMNPQYTIVSVGKKPDTDASNKYRQYSDYVWSTRWKGNITLTIDSNGKATIESEYDR